jgi:geranylgeranyl pyrophosphate synthase
MSNSELTTEMQETKALIELELSKLVCSLELKLSPQVKYALLSGGKRLRPMILLLAAQSVGGDQKKAVPLALAFELAHNGSLVQDDIIDKDAFRREKLAVYKNWSANAAMLTGDLLIAYAVYLASNYDKNILKMFSESIIELCEGEYMDLMLTLDSTEKEYFEMIKSKSASLFQAAASCGALVAGASIEEYECLSNFGKNFGIAYQLKDDLSDLKLEESQVSEDLKKGRVTLPLIHLYSNSNSLEKKAIDEALRIAVMKDGSKSCTAVKGIIKKLEETGSIDYVEEKLYEYLQLTIASIAPLKDSSYKLALLQMSEVLERKQKSK